MNAAIYARVSTTRQENENQLRELRRFAAKQRWEIAAEYVEVVTGSGKKDRAQFDRMMLAASQRRFDVVLFWKLDRFSREGVRKTLEHLDRLEKWGVAWRSFTEPFFDSCGPFKDAVISIMSTLAQQERISIGERTRAGMARARAAGRHIGRPAARISGERVQQLRSEGLTFRQIAAKLKVCPATAFKVSRAVS